MLPMRWSGPAFAVLLFLALIAFWPGYLGLPKAQFNWWFHLHATTGSLWMLMLIAQPLLIHSGRRELHRRIGRTSYVLMPVIVISFVGLAHAVMQGKTGSEFGEQAYLFYVRVVLVAIFVASYVMAMIKRHHPAIHARYMVCTGLALVDPVVSRLAYRALGRNQEFNYQLFTFGLVCLILMALIWMERSARSGRRVFPTMLAAFFVGGLPLALNFYTWGWPWELWKSFAASFAALPLP